MNPGPNALCTRKQAAITFSVTGSRSSFFISVIYVHLRNHCRSFGATAPEAIRTPNLRSRSPPFYPIELRAHYREQETGIRGQGSFAINPFKFRGNYTKFRSSVNLGEIRWVYVIF